MKDKEIHVIDGFYSDPYQIRTKALTKHFDVRGNYPGFRTIPEDVQTAKWLKLRFQGILNREITYWPGEYNTAYQYTTKDDHTWVHHDDTTWAAVCYLTPGAPLDSGTILCRHKATGIDFWDREIPATDFNNSNDLADMSKWEIVADISNIFNRLVLYRGEYYHRSNRAGFGSDKYTGRLFQTFFFNTKES